jgi:replicative DNA helicase
VTERTERTLPHNLEAERSVLGACLLDRDSLLEAQEALKPGDFYDARHQRAYEIFREMSRMDKPVDPLSVWEEIQRRELSDQMGGQGFLAALVDAVPTLAHVPHHIHIVRDKSVHRRLVQAGMDIIKSAYAEGADLEQILKDAERSIFDIAEGGSEGDFSHVGDLLADAFREIEARYAQDEPAMGSTSGFAEMDRLTGGFQPGSLNIIAARPSMGKTALALNIAQYTAIRKKKPVLIFSLEMGGEQLAQRMLASEAGVNVHDIRTGTFHERAWEDLARAADSLSGAAIYIDDSSVLSPLDLKSRSRRFRARHGGEIGMIVVDYLQLMHLPRSPESKQQEIAEISRSLKGIARELEVPLLVLSQLSRAVESRPDKRPQLSDLRDSGAIEQDADLVALLYRSGYYTQNTPGAEEDNSAEVSIAKHRNGPTGVVHLVFEKPYARFVEAGRRFV